ncbi:MAG: hypothetical protein ISS19_18065 [Bacteroidales bacterium]|nr:hypothetical protein [Bacteroidales bacterium]
MKRFKNILLVFLILLLPGCPGVEPLPDTPFIEFKDFTLEESVDDLGNEIILGELLFFFQDGDGDVGLHEPDTVFPGDSSQYNLLFTMFKKEDQEYIQLTEDDLGSPLYYRIPFIEREGQNKTLKGEIEVTFEYLTIEYDTIRYTFYIVDREKHKSNSDTTFDISFTEFREIR